MTMPRLLLRVGLAGSLSFFAVHSSAQVPQIVNYQGRVAVGAVNFEGTGQFKFALVNGGTAPPPNPFITYWSNDGSSIAGAQPNSAVAIPVTKGLYAVLLGD